MKNSKDTISTICGIVFAIGTSLLAIQTQISLPPIVITIAGSLVALSGGILGVATGKNADMSTKTPEQVAAASAPNGVPKMENPPFPPNK